MMSRPVSGLVYDERMLLHENPWDEESQAEWDRRVAEIVSRTERRLTKYKLG